jgi:hypothetical protein
VGGEALASIDLEDALRIAVDGDAVLFVGAGVGFLAQGNRGSLPDAPKLSNRLLERADDAPSPPALDKVAGYIIRQGKGAEFLYNVLTENLKVNSVDDGLALLYRLPWRRIYTTNYDDAIELARHGHVGVSTCTLESDPATLSPSAIVHLNGYLGHISPSSLERGLTLSDASYAMPRLENSRWNQIFLRDIGQARAIIFLGYSVYDQDIARSLMEIGCQSRSLFFVSPTIDPVDRSTVELFGTVVDGGALALISAAKAVVAGYRPRTPSTNFVSLRELKLDPDYQTRPASRMIENQLVFGQLPEQALLRGDRSFGDQPYITKRLSQIDVQNRIRRGVVRDVLIVGEVASGKSATALSISASLVHDGYRVYIASRGATLVSDLMQLAGIDDRVAVVFENYTDFKEAIREYANKRNPRHRIIMTEQAFRHELHGDFVYEPMFAGQLGEIVLDSMSIDECRFFADLLNFGGYWGSRAGGSTDANASYIKKTLGGSLYRLLLEIIESDHVQRRVNGILEPIFLNDRATKLFVAACIANVLGIEYNVSEWPSLMEPQLARRILRSYKDQLGYFMSVDGGRVFPRSGLLSASILRRVPDQSQVVDVAVEMFSTAARLKVPYDMYDAAHVKLMRFNMIEPILHGPNVKALVFRYYDEIRPIGDTHKGSDYWLQLGIAATALDDLPVAKDAFENAYAREKRRPRPNFKKIDNYFARYQLRAAAETTSGDEAFQLFVKGTSGITKQIFFEDNRHYPFKSGRAYAQIASRHYSNWSPDQRNTFVHAVDQIRSLASDWLVKNGSHSIDVTHLVRETTDLLKRLRSTP